MDITVTISGKLKNSGRKVEATGQKFPVRTTSLAKQYWRRRWVAGGSAPDYRARLRDDGVRLLVGGTTFFGEGRDLIRTLKL